MEQNKQFKGRCILHPGLFVGVTEFTTNLNEAEDRPYIGYGVFTDQDIPAGTILEECIAATERLSNDSNAMKTYRFPSSVLDNKGNTGFKILLGMTSICNHDESNFNVIAHESKQFIRMSVLVAYKDIKAGEELLLNYTAISGPKGDK